VSVAIKKLDGVASVEVSLERASADIRLKPDNKITLPQLRQIIKKNGYPTKDAQVTARGQIVDQKGTPMLDLLNGTALSLTQRPPSQRVGIVEVTGVSRVLGKDTEQLTVATVK
jgi:copper chaperone CopZ